MLQTLQFYHIRQEFKGDSKLGDTFLIIRYSGYPQADFQESGGRQNKKKSEKDLKMGCVREGKVRVDVLKVHICYDNTLSSITFEPVVRF